MKVGVKDIAKKAGVSVGAVSLALNNKKGVSEETRKKIIQIANEMNYLSSGTNKNFAPKLQTYRYRLVIVSKNMVVGADARNQPFFSSLINEILSLSDHKSLSITLSFVNHSDLHIHLQDIAIQNEIDGVILLSTDLEDNDLILSIKDLDIPIILLDSTHKNLAMNQIGINNQQGATIAAEYILGKKYKRIGYAMSIDRIHNFKERFSAFFSYIKQHDSLIEEKYIFEFPSGSLNKNILVGEQIKNLKLLPSVIFCENDIIAISLIKTLEDINLKVPDDIAVIGFDDIPEGRIISPELTTISVDKNSFAKLTINQLTNLIEHQTVYQTLMNCTLVVRNSA